MALGLVSRSARALAEHLNTFYRVWKGIDADWVALRLPAGGAFEVRHSVTSAPVLRVTDAGVVTAGAVSLPDNTITSAMIADGTIQGIDIASNTITSDKLQSGIAVPAGSITTAEIADGTIQPADLAANAIHGASVTVVPTVSQTTSGTAFPNPMTHGPVSLTLSAGWDAEVDIGLRLSQSLLGHSVTVFLYVDGGPVKEICNFTEALAGGGWSVARHFYLSGLSAAAHTFVLHWLVSSGTATLGNGELSVRAVKR